MFYFRVFMEQKEIQLLVITLSFVFLTIIVFLFVLFFYFQKRKTAFLIEKMESDLRFQSELVKTQIEIKDQTLSEISKELHDNIGQILSVAIMQVNMYAHDPLRKMATHEWNDLKGVLSKSLDEIRVLTKIMNRDNADRLDFTHAIALDFERIRKLKKIDCSFTLIGEFPEINSEHELIIYRIFQEAIHNVLRHSQSETIAMRVECTPKKITVQLIDKGIGFDTTGQNSGLGLHNMQLRSNLIGAQMTITSGFEGTKIELDYPIHKEDE